jgi:L-lysine 2,3-aminomutase
MADLKFATQEIETLITYLRMHPEISDILFTGGDPLIMKTDILASYIRPLLEADLPNLQSIRIGTKALAYWPYRFLTDSDSEQLLGLFREVIQRGKHLAFMANFSHPKELETSAVQEAIFKIRKTGTQIRTQSPILAHINDKPGIWQQMWQKQVNLGCIPYYMFVVRNTGAQHYFGIPLVRAWEIFQNAYKNVSGLSRTVRGPSMSATPGKVHILGVNEIHGKKVLVMQFLQARNPDWVRRPFFARYDEQAIWLDELKPAFGEEKFFFEDDDSLGREPHQSRHHRICETK